MERFCILINEIFITFIKKPTLLSRKENIAVLSLLVAILACIATFLTVPQIGSYFFGPQQNDSDSSKHSETPTNAGTSDLNNNSPTKPTEGNNQDKNTIYEIKDTVIELPSREYKLSHVGSGDHNLNINKNNPLYYHCRGWIEVVENSFLRSNISVRISERKEDQTAGEVSETETIFMASSGWEIAGFIPRHPFDERGDYSEGRPGFLVESLEPNQSIEKFWIQGDHPYRNDIPGYSSVQIFWRPITIKLIRLKKTSE